MFLALSVLAAGSAFGAEEGIPRPPSGEMRIPPRYLSGARGPADPASVAAERPYEAMRRAVAEAATRYLETGEVGGALRVFEILDAWAGAGALLDYDRKAWPQSWYQCEWSLSGVGLSAWAVMSEPSIPADRKARVLDWMRRAAWKLVDEKPGPDTTRNNHAYWRGLAAAAVGAATNDGALFERGVAAYRVGLGEIAEDGRLPLETARHEKAIHYQNFAITPLVGIAELAARRGLDLYGETNARGRRLADAVNFLLDALDDPTRVRPRTSEEQDLRSLHAGAADLAWIVPYRARFPSPRLDRWVEPRVSPYSNLGGAALYPR